MKKENITFKMLSLIAMTLIVNSCAKQFPIDKSTDKNQTTASPLLRIQPADMENAYNHFITITLSENPVYENAACDDAVLLTEAALNYHFGNPSQICDKTQVDSASFSIVANRNEDGQYMISVDGMQSLYEEMSNYYANLIENKYSSFEHFDVKIVVIDLESVTSIDSTQNQITYHIKGSAVIGVNYLGTHPCGYTYLDSWSIYPWVGGCLLNTATSGSAYDEMKKRWNNTGCHQTLSLCGYFGNIQQIDYNTSIGTTLLNPNDITPSDNYRDYLLPNALANGVPFTTCIEYTELSFYSDAFYSYCVFNAPNNPPGLTGIKRPIVFVSAGSLTNPVYPYNYSSIATVKFGTCFKYYP